MELDSKKGLCRGTSAEFSFQWTPKSTNSAGYLWWRSISDRLAKDATDREPILRRIVNDYTRRSLMNDEIRPFCRPCPACSPQRCIMTLIPSDHET